MDSGRESYTPTQSGRRAPLVNSGIIIFASVFFSLVIHAVPKVGAESPYQIRYADPTQQPWRVSRYRELEGHGVRCVTEGKRGAMWFGLQNGAVKYDGYHWQFYDADDGLPEGSVEWLETRSDGSIVAATKSGLYQLTDQKWKPLFSSARDPFPAISFVMETSDRTLWSACEWGLIRFRDQQATIFTSQQYARIIRREKLFDDVIVLPDECLPSARFYRGTGIAVLGRSVVALAGDSAAIAAGLQVDDRILKVNGESRTLFQSLQRESGDTVKLVVGRFDSGSVETIEFTASDTEGKFQHPAIHSVTEDSQNRIWVGAKNGSVFLSSDGGNSWVTPPGNDELLVKQRPFVTELSNGDIMVVSAGRNGTVYRFDGKRWSREPLSMLRN